MARLKDLRPLLGPARSQGSRSTCLAFAVTAAHERHDARDQVTLAVEVLYWGAKQVDGYAGQGTTFTAAAMAIRKWGQPEEAHWPYDPARDDRVSTYTPPSAAIAPANCVFADMRNIATTRASVKAELDEDRVVTIGAPTWRGLRRPVAGRIANPTPKDLDGGLHAMAIVGYSEDTGEFLIRNSWGESWGISGHAWVPMAFVEDHVMGAWVVDAAPATGPTPTVGPPAADALFGDDGA